MIDWLIDGSQHISIYSSSFRMLQCDVSKRPSADKCLSHHFFTHKFSTSVKDMMLLPTRILRLLDVTADIDLKDEEEYKGTRTYVQYTHNFLENSICWNEISKFTKQEERDL